MTDTEIIDDPTFAEQSPKEPVVVIKKKQRSKPKIVKCECGVELRSNQMKRHKLTELHKLKIPSEQRMFAIMEEQQRQFKDMSMWSKESKDM
jgi:hypothetical protein